MGSPYEELTELLGMHLSLVNVKGLLSRALREANLTPEAMLRRDIPRLMPRIERGIRLFLEPAEQGRVRRALDELCGGELEGRTESVPVSIEDDVSTARVAARAMCADARARPLVVQRVVTIVSEFARNIAMYTPGGSIKLILSVDGTRRKILILATDRGNGIPHLDDVLSGRYRSKSGLGKGLTGVRKIADRFDIQAGPTGTRVEAEVEL